MGWDGVTWCVSGSDQGDYRQLLSASFNDLHSAETIFFAKNVYASLQSIKLCIDVIAAP